MTTARVHAPRGGSVPVQPPPAASAVRRTVRVVTDPASLARAYRSACLAELLALKPGNVWLRRPGDPPPRRDRHGPETVARDFLRSAAATAPPLCRPDAGLGARLLGAVAATRLAVGQNTNLGILLLCAPLAMAASRPAESLGSALGAVLDTAGPADARAAFRAIVLASPGGLGGADEHDVREPPRAGLLDAMRAAAGRDSIARQWANGFADVLGPCLDTLREGRARWGREADGVILCFLRALSAWPDSHIARRRGPDAARTVLREARAMLQRLDASSPEALRPVLLDWDASLRDRRLNPGTSADLVVAALFADRLGA